MKKLISTWKIWQFVEAALLVILGVTTIVCAFSNKDNVIGLVAGVILIVDGTIHAAINLFIKSTDIKFSTQAIAVAELALGIWLCIKPDQLAENVVLIASLTILVTGVLFLADSIFAAIHKSQAIKYLVMQFTISILIIAAGVVALVFYPFKPSTADDFNTKKLILALLGGVLIALAFYEVTTTTIAISKAKKVEEKAIEEEAIKREEKRNKKRKEVVEIVETESNTEENQ